MVEREKQRDRLFIVTAGLHTGILGGSYINIWPQVVKANAACYPPPPLCSALNPLVMVYVTEPGLVAVCVRANCDQISDRTTLTCKNVGWTIKPSIQRDSCVQARH